MLYRKSTKLSGFVIKLCIGVSLVYGGMTGSIMAAGYQSVSPWMGPFSRPFYPGNAGQYYYFPYYQAWPGYYPVGRSNPWRYSPMSGVSNYRGPWGNMRGGIAPDGTFWVNIHFGGSYNDLRTLFTLMQLSGGMQMNSGSRRYPAPVMAINENM